MGGLVGNRMPPLQSVRFAAKVYGQLRGHGHRNNAMLWVLADRRAVVVQNSYNGDPDGVSRTEYPIDQVIVGPFGFTVKIIGSDETLNMVEAPCVCGAGPTATALPEPQLAGHRIDLQAVESMPEWVVRA